MVQITLPDDVVLFYYDDLKKGLIPVKELKDGLPYYVIRPNNPYPISTGIYRTFNQKQFDGLRHDFLRGSEYSFIPRPASRKQGLSGLLEKDPTTSLFFTPFAYPTLDEREVPKEWVMAGRVLHLANDEALALKPNESAFSIPGEAELIGTATTLVDYSKTKPADNFTTHTLIPFLPTLRRDRENSLILSLKNRQDLFPVEDITRHKKYLRLCKSFTSAFYQSNRDKARKFLLIEVALLGNKKPAKEVFIEALKEYQAERLAKRDPNGNTVDYYTSFARNTPGAYFERTHSCCARFFPDARSQFAKARAVDTLVQRLENGTFDFVDQKSKGLEVPAAAKNGELEDLIKFFKARYSAEQLNAKPVPQNEHDIDEDELEAEDSRRSASMSQ